MGDRCCMMITCRAQDAARFEPEGFVREGDVAADGLATMVDEGRNYADMDGLPKDVPYTGAHSSGDSYSPGIFACDGLQFAYAQCRQDSNWPAADINEHGEPNTVQMGDAIRYWRIQRRAKAMLEGAPADEDEPKRIIRRLLSALNGSLMGDDVTRTVQAAERYIEGERDAEDGEEDADEV